MADYRATPEAWADTERWAKHADAHACIIELRARVEALEANSSARLTGSNYPVKPDSSLVERVAVAVDSASWQDNGEARAAIREVAAWLAENAGGTRAAWLLGQEAER